MFRRSVLACVAAVMVCTPSSSFAQEAERAGGPLHVVGSNPTVVVLIAGELPETAPETPVDVWIWSFYNSIGTVRDISFDANASLMRVDCQARTLQSQRLELFLEDRQVAGETSAGPIETPGTDTLPHMLMMDICVPSQRVALDAPFPDHRIARAAVRRHFNSQ
ncbi:hypothetical protein AB2N04_13995 [Nitratireductor sp. GISD-1A_MAKvit]|uniref:hypothetical protein n=1 Tax=Nitratireductor sp. GISD-1A_MAKvit TaxID=3234198 RepID=UPI0034679E56